MDLLNMARATQIRNIQARFLEHYHKNEFMRTSSIHEAQRSQLLTLNKLIGILMPYEVKSKNEQAKTKGKKSFAYIGNTLHVDFEGLSSNDNGDDDNDEDMASLI